MVLYTLYAKADLEGIYSLSLTPNTNICISVKNTLPEDPQTRERIVIDPTELHEASIPNHEKHRAEHASHFALTWEGAQTRSTIQILTNDKKENGDDDEEATEKEKKHKKKNKQHKETASSTAAAAAAIKTRPLQPQDNGQYVPILKLECNGLEPYAFHPMGEEFEVILNNRGKKVENVDLSSGEWTDYDLSSGTALISNFETKFE